jgi:hypothetical protein
MAVLFPGSNGRYPVRGLAILASSQCLGRRCRSRVLQRKPRCSGPRTNRTTMNLMATAPRGRLGLWRRRWGGFQQRPASRCRRRRDARCEQSLEEEDEDGEIHDEGVVAETDETMNDAAAKEA